METTSENELRIMYDTPKGPRTLCIIWERDTMCLGNASIYEEKMDLQETVRITAHSNDVPGLVQAVLARLRQH